MKCLFGSNFGHLIYQNLDYEACVLDIWSQGMSQNSYHYQQNNKWAETMFFCLPNHVFQPAHFIGEIAQVQISMEVGRWWLYCVSKFIALQT